MTIKQQGGIFGRNPTFNDVSANTTTTNTLTADASADGSVVIVKRDGSNVGSLGAKSGDLFISSDTMGMRFRDSISAIIPSVDGATGSDASFDLGNDSNRWRKLYLSGNLVVASGSGIDFSATSGTGTSELFDDYEEGTWTPVPSDATSGGNVGTGTISGLYTKVGNIVTAQFRIVNLDTTGMTAGNALRIQGLPFTSLSGAGSFVGSLDVQNVTFSDGISLQNSSGQSYLTLRELASAGAGSNLTVSDFTSGSADVFGSITYTAA